MNIKPIFILLVAGVTLSTYVTTIFIAKTPKESRKKWLMRLNIVLVLLPLAFFKYFGDINEGIIEIMSTYGLHWPLPEMRYMLPVGISFYTFMAIGYTVDVYNEEIEVEKNIGILALFISFFPLILSGPIERAGNMIPQFRNIGMMNWNNVSSGLKLIVWGYFLKLVVADRLGLYIDSVYANIDKHNGTTLLLTSALYPFQVYADLGGYSLIAIGIAKVFGFKVIDNFKRPFYAISMSEFWRRWHISLISWLTDYIYTPISFAFRRYKVWGIVTALMVTFIISGIWHGAALTFVAWGVLQGIFLSIEALFHTKRNTFERKFNLNNNVLYITCCIGLTFILFSISQVFGRAASINEAYMIFTKIFTSHGQLYIGTPAFMIYSLIGIAIVLIKDFFEEFYPDRFLLFGSRSVFTRAISYSVAVILILLFGVFDGGQFIYFQY
jgi:alginate O-acetyltransferase complex protein AlgI